MNRSKVIVLYVAPWMTLTAILLFLFAYLAPVVLFQTRVAMLAVTSASGDGPSVFLGPFGSCSRATNHARVKCTSLSANPVYDLSGLLAGPHFLLPAPPLPPGFLGFALAYSFIFFIFFTLMSFRHKMGEKVAATLDKPIPETESPVNRRQRIFVWVGVSGHKMGEKVAAMLDSPIAQRIFVWDGVSGFLFGFTTFLISRIWFGKAADDFNQSIAIGGSAGPQLTATVGNAFIMVWVAYGIFGVLLVLSMMKLNVKASEWTDS